jgi:hypothetical protein
MHAQPFNTHMVSYVDPMHTKMASQLHQTPLPLAPVRAKAVALDCNSGRLSADTGLLWRKDIADQLGFTRHRAVVLSDPRDARRVKFTLHDLIKQRVFHMAAGYEDANNTLRYVSRSSCRSIDG